jgi:mono/diheme cytochrome c family protein
MQWPRVARWVVIVVVLTAAGCGNGGMGHGMDHDMGPGMMQGQGGEPPAVTAVPTATPGGSATVSYRRDIQPIFDRNCVNCHGGSAGLWLDRYERIMAGSNRGAVIMPGNASQSELYRRITGQSQPRMPLGGSTLSQGDIDAIRTWIEEGAPNN